MADNSVAEVVARIVTPQIIAHFEGIVAQFNAEAQSVRERADAAIADVVERIEVEGREQVTAAIHNLPVTAGVTTAAGDTFDAADTVAWIKAQAASRAWRTLVQGVVSAVVIAFVTAVVQALVVPGFDFFALQDWKIAVGLGLGAVGTALVSLLQNKLGIKPPPKVQ
ncbi:hypothetical protein [Rhodococcoides fascians]|uniref:hypothetical protein n=1 Tax=Rhodococcoides fascians TaxID=1828 RepID=UPI00050CAF5A|nr:hypothetical protein [Rhodococcus fascians]